MVRRTYYDPLHKSISLDGDIPAERMVISLIDSKPFQRLRRIKQLGPAYLTFHGAESSRFTHSLGVFYLARKAFKILIKKDPSLEEHQGLIYGAALLHDIGHGPLSHTGEEMFGLKHEVWSANLINNHPEIKEALEAFKKGTAQKIAYLIEKGIAPRKIISSLISSQLDCDRLDYLLRDSYSTGAAYGQLDLERILNALTISPDGDLAINPKGIMAVEHYLVVRHLMYRSVYNHRLNDVCCWLLEKIINLARQLGPKVVWSDKSMYKWLWEKNKVDINTFLLNDDVNTGYHISRWSQESAEPLKGMCSRFLNRELLQAIDINDLSNERQLIALTKARDLAVKIGADPDLLCGIRHQQIHSYKPYEGGLRTWDGLHLKALEDSSNLVKGLISPIGVAWLIHPKEVHKDLKDEIEKMG